MAVSVLLAAGSVVVLAWIVSVYGCSAAPTTVRGLDEGRDVHSFARPDEVVVRRLELDLAVDFEAKRLTGTASFDIENRAGSPSLVLDTRDLEIERVTLGDPAARAAFKLGEAVPFLGRPLEIDVRPDTTRVTVHYRTSPGAAGLQWLAPAQTAGRDYPFLYTQSQAILARTWVPCQDTPRVRQTYCARIHVPPSLLALMSARNASRLSADGTYVFDMPEPIPSYLLALAVGRLEFRPLGPRSGVYAEAPVIEAAAYEFAETERMIAAAESLYGPYRWERYDVLVLPPSFPFGGMENPRLTFATPTILAGDRSLVALVAHELAHSWSGNLVTNATWSDFWLNEGFTVYFEQRIMEAVYGREVSEMLALLGKGELEKLLDELGRESRDTHLSLDLVGRDPDDAMNEVAYQKGYLFLRRVEETVGRTRWDAFLRRYFDRFAFQSLSTPAFVAYLREDLVKGDRALEAALEIDRWIYGPGLPASCPAVRSEALVEAERAAKAWAGGTPARDLQTTGFTTHHWVQFLRCLPESMTNAQMADLDAAFHFTDTGNSEILEAWLLHAIANRYEPADLALERFLTGMGRRKYLKPLYAKLSETPQGLERAKRIYEKARPGYHSVSAGTIDAILARPASGTAR